MYVIDFMQEAVYKINRVEHGKIGSFLNRWSRRFTIVSSEVMDSLLEQEPRIKEYFRSKEKLMELAKEWRERKC